MFLALQLNRQSNDIGTIPEEYVRAVKQFAVLGDLLLCEGAEVFFT